MRKKIMGIVTFVLCLATTSVIAFAEEAYDMTGAMSTAMDSLSTQIFAIIGIVVPVVLAILGGKLAITKGISMFKSLVGR